MTREKFTALVSANELRRLDMARLQRQFNALKDEVVRQEDIIRDARAELLKEEG